MEQLIKPSSRKRLLIAYYFILAVQVLSYCWIVNANAVATKNAYQILQLPSSSKVTQDEIKSQYRKLCLRHHPDKNTQKSDEERKKEEERFKLIQLAYEQLRDPIKRQQYDSQLRSRISKAATDSFQQAAANSAMYNQYFHSSTRPSFPSRAFYVNGVDISQLWNNLPRQQEKRCKMIYEQEVSIPLQDLYSGKARHVFTLDSINTNKIISVWNRYKAAYRGGFLSEVLARGLVSFALAANQLRIPFAVAVFAGYIYSNVPPPVATQSFIGDIKKGWKGGTKLTFQVRDQQPYCTLVTFILKEELHERYSRSGDNLITQVAISKAKALNGCEIMIPALNSKAELPILVRIKPGQFHEEDCSTTNKIVVKGRGWPKRDGSRGDLVVQVHIR